MKILVVDDEATLVKGIRFNLQAEGYQVVTGSTGTDAVRLTRNEVPDLIVLDVMMPEMDGFAACKAIREFSTVHIIILTAKSESGIKLDGFDCGADDYMTKPFEGKELLARVKAVLRRSAPASSEKDTLSFPGLTVSLEKYEVYSQGKPVEMPPQELEVLYFLASHQNRVFTREQLLEQVWGFDFFGDSRTVDVHIKRLREKLPDSEQYGWQIRTVWSVGYKFEVK